MSRVAVLPGLDPATYQRHALHADDQVWVEKNCYIDIWIETVHALGLDPTAMLGFTVAQAGVANLQDLNDFLSLEMRMLLVFGISFLLPVILVMLNMLGMLKSWQLRKARTIAIFVCFVFGAVATPSGDPFSMLALSLPMVIMYVVSELICSRREKRSLKLRIRSGEISPEEAEAAYLGKTIQTDDK